MSGLHDSLLREVQLPPEIVATVRHVARRARLRAAERADLVAELIAHFEDGLDAGASPDELLSSFGDARRTAGMIHRARLRCRPPAWRALALAGRAALVVLPVVLTLYTVSAVSLFLGQRSVSSDPPLETVEREWGRHPEAQLSVERGWAHIAMARQAAAANRPAMFEQEMRKALVLADRASARRSAAGDLIAARIETRALQTLTDHVDGACQAALPIDLQPWLERLDRPRRLDGLRRSFGDLTARMYTDDGRLTFAGIEEMHRVRGWGDLDWADALMQPVWYVFPASQHEVVDRVESLIGLVEREAAPPAAITDAVHAIQREPYTCQRFPGLKAALPEIYRILSDAAAAETARLQALARLKQAAGESCRAAL